MHLTEEEAKLQQNDAELKRHLSWWENEKQTVLRDKAPNWEDQLNIIYGHIYSIKNHLERSNIPC